MKYFVILFVLFVVVCTEAWSGEGSPENSESSESDESSNGSFNFNNGPIFLPSDISRPPVNSHERLLVQILILLKQIHEKQCELSSGGNNPVPKPPIEGPSNDIPSTQAPSS